MMNCVRPITSQLMRLKNHPRSGLYVIWMRVLLLYLFLLWWIWQGILTTLSQSDGKYKYDYATVPFLAEVFKVLNPSWYPVSITLHRSPLSSLKRLLLQLLVSSILLRRECLRSPPPLMTTEWKSIRLYPIPSIIYLIHNNVQFATLTYVDTSTYQIMGNLKIVTTAILFRWYFWSLFLFTHSIFFLFPTFSFL